MEGSGVSNNKKPISSYLLLPLLLLLLADPDFGRPSLPAPPRQNAPTLTDGLLGGSFFRSSDIVPPATGGLPPAALSDTLPSSPLSVPLAPLVHLPTRSLSRKTCATLLPLPIFILLLTWVLLVSRTGNLLRPTRIPPKSQGKRKQEGKKINKNKK